MVQRRGNRAKHDFQTARKHANALGREDRAGDGELRTLPRLLVLLGFACFLCVFLLFARTRFCVGGGRGIRFSKTKEESAQVNFLCLRFRALAL